MVHKVFFYGLFMDENLLASKGIKTSNAQAGFVDDYRLRIGERATLLPEPAGRAYGVVMEIAQSEVAELYAEDSVADYLPEPVKVELLDGSKVAATCYNLSGDKIKGTNNDYAASLLRLAERLGFPGSYLAEIEQATK